MLAYTLKGPQLTSAVVNCSPGRQYQNSLHSLRDFNSVILKTKAKLKPNRQRPSPIQGLKATGNSGANFQIFDSHLDFMMLSSVVQLVQLVI